MAYDPQNPPGLISQRVGIKDQAGSIWAYASADPLATVLGADYFTNGGDIGMAFGDVVHVYDTNLVITSITYVKTYNGQAVTVVVVA